MIIAKGCANFKIPLTGTIRSEISITGKLKTEDVVFGKIQLSGNLSIYNGDYTVTPSVEEQTLKTANKKMLEDITVKKIPFYETSNLSGGNTVYIGNEVE